MQRSRLFLTAKTGRVEFAERCRSALAKCSLGHTGLQALNRRRDWLQEQVSTFRLGPILEDPSAVHGAADQQPLVVMYGSSVAGTAFAHADADFALAFPSDYSRTPSSAGAEIPAPSHDATAMPAKVPLAAMGNSCGFLTIHREAQPLVLGSLYETLVDRGAIGDQRSSSSAVVPPSLLSPEGQGGGEGRHLASTAKGSSESSEEGGRVKLQRIFRARIPILQCIPPERTRTLLAVPQTPKAVDGEERTAVGPPSSLLSSSKPAPAPLGISSAKTAHSSPSYLVHSAMAPVIKKGLHFDLSLSLDGIKNSLLLRHYMEQYPRLRGVTLLLKRWARRHRILNARRGWISPYALTVMVVHYMHASGRVSELIPTDSVNDQLRAMASRARASDMTSSSLNNVEDVAMTTILPIEAMLASVDDVLDDIKGFFDFYSGDSSSSLFELDADVADIRTVDRMRTKEQWLATSVRDGGLMELSEKERWHQIGYGVMMLRDPYEGHSL